MFPNSLDYEINVNEEPAIAGSKRVEDEFDKIGVRAKGAADMAASSIDRLVNSIASMAVSVGRGIGSVLDTIIKLTIKATEVMGGFLLLRQGWKMMTGDLEGHAGVLERIVNLGRAARLSFVGVTQGITSTAFAVTGAEIAAVIAAEEAIRAGYSRGGMIQRSAMQSARSGMSLQDVQLLSGASRMGGMDKDFLLGAAGKVGGLDNLVQAGRNLSGLTDPLDRAKKAVELFGSSAETYLPKVTDAIGDNVEALRKWGAVMDDESAQTVSYFKDQVDGLRAVWQGLTSDISAAGEAFKNWAATRGAELGTGLIVGAKSMLSAPNGAVFGTPPSGAPSYEEIARDWQAAQSRNPGVGNYLQQFATSMQVGNPALAALQKFQQTRAGFQANLSAMESMRTQAAETLQKYLSGQIKLSPSDLLLTSSLYTSGTQGAATAKEALRGMDESRTSIESTLRSRESLRDARTAYSRLHTGEPESYSGLRAISADYQRQLQPTYTVDDDNIVRQHNLSTDAKLNYEKAATYRMLAEVAAERNKRLFEEKTKAIELFSQQIQEMQAFDKGLADFRRHANETAFDETEKAMRDSYRRREDFEIDELSASKDHQLRQLDGIYTVTIQQKMALEQQKGDIEKRFLDESLQRQIEVLRRRSEVQIQEAQRGITDPSVRDFIRFGYDQKLGNDVEVLSRQTYDKIQASQDQVNIRQIELMRGQFDQLRSQADGIFDAMLTRSKGLWDAIKNMFLGALLTPVKQAFSTAVAGLLMPVLYGGSAAAAGLGGGSGAASSAAPSSAGALAPGAASAIDPAYWGHMLTGWGMGEAPVSSVGAIVGGPGGTSGFAGPVMMGGGGGVGGGGMSLGGIFGSGTGGGLGIGNLKGVLGNLRNLTGIGKDITVGNTGIGGSITKVSWADATRLEKLQGVASSPLAGALGAMLFMDSLKRRSARSEIEATAGGGLAGASIANQMGLDPVSGGIAGAGIGIGIAGLRRGGKIGLLESTGGFAAAGFMIGGPIGAAVGAGVGLGLGLARLTGLWSTFVEQIQHRVKSKYGITVDYNFGQQLAQMIKEQYHGSIEIGISSKPVRDLIQLYAQTTAQKMPLDPYTVRPYSLSESGGKLYQDPTYVNGAAYSFAGGPPVSGPYSTVGTLPAPMYGGSGPTVIQNHISLDGPSSAAFLQGQTVQAIQSSPRAVSSSFARGARASAGRRSSATALMSPNLITS